MTSSSRPFCAVIRPEIGNRKSRGSPTSCIGYLINVLRTITRLIRTTASRATTIRYEFQPQTTKVNRKESRHESNFMEYHSHSGPDLRSSRIRLLSPCRCANPMHDAGRVGTEIRIIRPVHTTPEQIPYTNFNILYSDLIVRERFKPNSAYQNRLKLDLP